jgi:hypothetical protein
MKKMKQYIKVVGFSVFPYPGAPNYQVPHNWFTPEEYQQKINDLTFMNLPYTHTALRIGQQITDIKALKMWSERLQEMKHERK